MIKYRTICLITLSFVFSACTTVQNIPSSTSSISQPKKNPEKLTAWQLSGAVAAKQHQKAWSASLTWEQLSSDHYQLSFFGPMGGNAVTIEKNNNTVTYQEGNKTEHSHNIDMLVYQKTGQKLPLSHLFYWIRGIKSPGAATELKDASGHLVQLKQAGYTLSYTNYRVINGYDLPTKIQIDHANGWLKLVIKDWDTHA